jgi:Tol biopolymer transport system component
VAVSPPFRIRAVTCVWPENPYILTNPTVISPNVAATYLGGVQAGTGVLTYTWNFGDGVPVNGQNTQYTFPANGTYPITLTVTGQACPQNRPVIVNKSISVGTGQANPQLYLPLLINGAGSVTNVQDDDTGTSTGAGGIDTTPGRPTAESTGTPTETASPTETETLAPTDTLTPTETLTPTDANPPTGTAPVETSPTGTVTPTDAAPPVEVTPPLDSTETPTGTVAASLAAGHLASWRQAAGAAKVQANAAAQAQASLAAQPLVSRQSVPALLPLSVASLPFTATQLTTLTTGINNEPAVNADGTRIIFWSTADPVGLNPDGNIEVFLLTTSAGGNTIKQISNSTGSILGGFNLSPSIDDAGDRMAFFSDRDLIGQNPDNNFEVYLYEASTDTLYQVTNTNKGFNILPSLSGDGQYVAFASDRDFAGTNPDGNTEIFRAQVGAGGAFTFAQITNSPAGINDQPRINRDGTRIAFVSNYNYPVVNAAPLSNSDNNREVFLAEVGTPVRIVQLSNTTTGSTGEPAINGNGTRVAFVSDRDPASGPGNPANLREIYYADVNGSYGLTISPVTTSTVEVGNGEPTISSDGSRVAFVSPGLNQVRLYDTLINTELVDTIGASLNPSLSAGGTVLVFAYNRQLYITSSPIAELVVTNVGVPSPVFENQPLRFTVVVSNAGPSIAENVRITETLPSGGFNAAELVFAANGTSCVTGVAPITCTIPSLAANTAVTLTIDLTPTVFGTITNTVRASTSTYERFTNNTVTRTVTVSPVPLVSVAITGPTTGLTHQGYTFVANVTPVSPSLQLTYTWQATGQTPVTFVSPAISSAVTYSWNPGGVQVITITVSNPASPIVTATHTITISNAVPTLTNIAPTTATVDSAGFSLVLTGTGFTANSVARWEATSLATTYVTSTTLQAAIPDVLLTSVGAHPVTVFNPEPGGGTSNSLNFTVNYPAPHITSTAPTRAVAGAPAFTLVITGSNFVSGATLHWSGQPDLPTSFNGLTLTANVPASYIDLEANVSLSVTNPSPSNGPSNTVPFTITNPTFTLTPSTAAIALNSTRLFTLTLSSVQASDRVFTLTSSNPAIATVPATVILPAGVTRTTFLATSLNLGGVTTITAKLPDSLGGSIDTSQLTVNYPAPVLSDLSPDTATAGGLTFTLTLTGSDFISGASLYWGSRPALPTSGSGSTLTANIPASYLLPDGTVALTVTNPSPNFGPSESLNFTVAKLQITLSPDPLIAGTGTTATITATVDALQAAARTITITSKPTRLLANTPPITFSLPEQTLETTFVITAGSGSTGVVTATLPSNVGGNFDEISLTVRNPATHITSTSPVSTVVGDPNFTIDITGRGFVSDSAVWWSGTQLTQTGFINFNQMTATVPAELFPVSGEYTLTVVNNPPGINLTSNAVTITVDNPLPTVTQLSPATALAGTPGFTLAVTGTGFINNDSTVLWNGAPRTTTWISSTRLQAAVTTADLVDPGVVTVTVVTVGPGGGTATPPLTFTITTLLPNLTSLNPTTRSVISPTFTLTVTGSNFVNPSGTPRDSVIQWSNGSITTTLTTTFINGTTMTASVSSGLFTTAGVYSVTVRNPDPSAGDQLSNRLPFTITNPAPLLTSLNPTFTVAGGLTFTLRVTGSNFINGASAVYLDGNLLPNSTYINSTVLTATVPNTYLTTPEYVSITVQTAGPGGGTSSPIAFGINNLPATLLAITPITGTVFSPLTIDVVGDDIASGSSLRWETTTLAPTTEISASELTADVPVELFPIGGVYSVTLLSPAPPAGGVVSTNALTVTIYNPVPNLRAASPPSAIAGTGAFTVTINSQTSQPSFVPGVQVSTTAGLRTTQYISSTQIQARLTATDLANAGSLVLTATNPSPNLGSSTFSFPVTSLAITLTPAATGPVTLPATHTFTITVGALQQASRTISLWASSATSITVPATVNLPPNDLNVTFVITGNLTGTVAVTATLPASLGGLSSSGLVTFHDAAITGLTAVNNSPKALGATTRFTATVSAGTNISYSWDFDDGSPVTAFTTVPTTTYTYTDGGFFTATVTARNSAGSVVTNTAVTINNPLPTITDVSPGTASTGVNTSFAITGTNFVAGASVRVISGATSTDLSGAAVTFVSSTRLTVAVPGSVINANGSYKFVVINPAPPASEANRRSNEFVFTVN